MEVRLSGRALRILIIVAFIVGVVVPSLVKISQTTVLSGTLNPRLQYLTMYAHTQQLFRNLTMSTVHANPRNNQRASGVL